MQTDRLINVIDKESPIPVYHQISTNLRSRIMAHEWQTGEKIPTEFELSDFYSVNRITVRKALEELERDELIKRFRGIGAILQAIPEPIMHDMSLPSTLCAKIGQKGVSLDAEILAIEDWPTPPAQITLALELPRDTPLIHISRLFIDSGIPIALNQSWIAQRLVPDIVELGLIKNHLSKTLTERYHLAPVKIKNHLEAVRPTAADIKQLKIQYDTPVIRISSISYLADKTPLEYSHTLWRGDRVNFHFDIE